MPENFTLSHLQTSANTTSVIENKGLGGFFPVIFLFELVKKMIHNH
jgi:hypothetical protein